LQRLLFKSVKNIFKSTVDKVNSTVKSIRILLKYKTIHAVLPLKAVAHNDIVGFIARIGLFYRQISLIMEDRGCLIWYGD
jgi:hypothetical protein